MAETELLEQEDELEEKTSDKVFIINEDWQIRFDSYNVILQFNQSFEKRIDGKASGEFYKKWTDVGYFHNIESLLKRLIHKIEFTGDVNSLQEYINKIKDYELIVEKFCKEYKVK